MAEKDKEWSEIDLVELYNRPVEKNKFEYISDFDSSEKFLDTSQMTLEELEEYAECDYNPKKYREHQKQKQKQKEKEADKRAWIIIFGFLYLLLSSFFQAINDDSSTQIAEKTGRELCLEEYREHEDYQLFLLCVRTHNFNREYD